MSDDFTVEKGDIFYDKDFDILTLVVNVNDTDMCVKHFRPVSMYWEVEQKIDGEKVGKVEL
jgi:hypothetical protein